MIPQGILDAVCFTSSGHRSWHGQPEVSVIFRISDEVEGRLQIVMSFEVRLGELTISCDKARLDLEMIQQFLANDSYWAQNRSIEQTTRAIENSICFGVFDAGRQIGFARVVSDQATFAYVGDVFILESHRGRGISKWLMETIVGHPDLQGLRRWVLATRDAHGLYRQFEFSELRHPERWMERTAPDAY